MKDSHSIELKDLRAAWVDLENRLNTNFGKVEALALELAASRTRSLVRRAMLPPIVDLAVAGLGLAIVCAGFAYAGSAVYVGCLLSVAAVLTLLITAAILQITMLAGTDAAAPVLTLQRRLERVRTFRIFEWKWILLLSPVLWGPFFVVTIELLLKSLSGDGPESTVFSASYIWANLAIGAVLSLGLYWLSRWFVRRFDGSRFLHRFMNDLAGRRLTAARESLQRLDRFEQG